MATYTVALDPLLGDYLSHQTALAAAVGAADPAANFHTVQGGDYLNQVLDFSPLSNARVTDEVDGKYTIGVDATGFYSFTVCNGLAMFGGSIRGKTNRTVYSAGGSAAFYSVTFYCESGTAGYMFRQIGGAVFTLQNCKIDGDTQAGSWMFILFAGSQLHLDNVYTTPAFTSFSTGFIYAYDGVIASLTIRSSNCPAGYLFNVRFASTITSLEISGSYSPTLVLKSGAITAFVGADNCYNTTNAGTSSATDKPGITDFDLDYRGAPNITSPLYRMIPPSSPLGLAKKDASGNPRNTGGWIDCGPLQQQYDTSYLDAMAMLQ